MTITVHPPIVPDTRPPIPRRHPATSTRIPLSRIVGVELRKSFDTRSGLWLLAGIAIASVLTTGAVVAWAPHDQFTYSEFTLAIGVPLSIILPIIAALSVAAEWTQRSGLNTFTLVPHRGRVLRAKAIAALVVAIVATAVALAVGAVGNLIGSSAAGIPAVWNEDVADVGGFLLGNILLMLVGFTLGALIRNSTGAVVAFMIYAFVAPGLLAFLAFNQRWFHDARPWVDAKYNQDALLQGHSLSGENWTQLAATSVAWVFIPLAVASFRVLRSEVK